MIDPAILDVMHQMNRQPPAQMLPVERPASASMARFFEELEATAQQVEADAYDWAARLQTAVTALSERAVERGLSAQSAAALRRSLEACESKTAQDARAFEVGRKKLWRTAKEVKAGSAADGLLFEREARRLLAIHAKIGMVRFEVGLALKATLAALDPESRSGPVFDDPEALEKYLLADAD